MFYSRMESVTMDKPDQTRLALSTTSIQDHGTADERFSFSVTHSYLSKQNYPAHFTKEEKHALRKRAKHFTCTDDRKLHYVGGASSISHCMLSVVITVTDCLLFYVSLNEILLC